MLWIIWKVATHFWELDFISFRKYQSKIASHIDHFIFNSFEDCLYYLPQWLYLIYDSTKVHKFRFTPHQYLSTCLDDNSLSTGMRWDNIPLAFLFTFWWLGVKHLFIYFLAIHVFFGECLFSTSAHFLVNLHGGFAIVLYMSFTYFILIHLLIPLVSFFILFFIVSFDV